ncbi:putative ATP-dependent endonuclease of OLD family [Nitrosospira sp. Nsp5]|uniref:Predicted ATP-dependent endonuclease of the OLD family, contains P-loop ATPase and TOPRIM domains n=1 Tax=Nitrosospira multiformis TaxID=1231 RepID=A0ABY0TFC8_9PROT|nr:MULTISPECIES: AAA family ATPase [Nitrosospira]PTR10848.1 putative ATP-dependent endonuclease of OLD family [Nitrosospira sp. Nsp5]SDQ73573.1 Predicted ATP-dependent endonuclease of the OLD family, contains P-loop ATPase and TOPRIM domains [Nitrosospira multiformis]
MKLVRARIQNFRSIDDSDEFSFDEHITCFVGKNESGKTTLLTALHRLNPIFDDARFDRQKDYPRRHLSDYEERHEGEDAAVVTTWWAIDPAEQQAITDVFGAGALASDKVVVQKDYSNRTRWTVSFDEAAIVQHLIDTSGFHDDEKAQIGTVRTVAELKAQTESLHETSPGRTHCLHRIGRDFPEGSVSQGIVQLLDLPKFMLFSQYQRMQGQVSLEQIRERESSNTLESSDQVFIALCDMASTTVEQVASIQDFESLVSRFEGASNKISAEMFRYWSQNKFLKVIFRLDHALPGDPSPFSSGRIFRTRILNKLHDVTVPFDDRSTGFVWFFSFLALFSQVKKRNQRKIILLLDEPGLSLHGKAQADLLRYFRERLAPDHQVIYTTHSPFMVPADDLPSVRTVEDVVIYHQDEAPEVRGTKVGGDVLSTDPDTLFPLQHALAYEITQALSANEHTLLVTRPSDLLYLRAMSEVLRSHKRTPLDPRWTICPAGGIEKISAFMSLFGGNRLQVAILTDLASDHEKVEDLRRWKILRDGHIFTAGAYAGQREADVEDMLGAGLYAEIVGASFGLKGKQAVAALPAGSRIVTHTTERFRTQPETALNTAPEFDRYVPAVYFTEHQSDIVKKLFGADLKVTLTRFEQLFSDLNALLPETRSAS